MSVRDRYDLEFAAPGEPVSPGVSELASVLDVRIRFTPHLPTVRLAGELDLDSLHLLTDALDAIAASACPADLVVLDLADVRFCDVAGLRAIEMCAATLTAVGKELVLYDTPPQVMKLIEITGVAGKVIHR